MKRILSAFAAIALVLALFTGCFLFNTINSPIFDYNFSEMSLVQLGSPYEHQPMVTVTTSYGEFSAVLYPEYAPNTVDNFIARVNDGFYDNKPVFQLLEGEYFVSGALNDDGSQGVTNDGKLIPNEYSVNLWPFKGALMSLSAQPGYGDSRFIVVGSAPFTDEDAEGLRSAKNSDGSNLIPEELIETFYNNDCVVGFSGGYTVFGQVINGFETLDAILSIKSDEEKHRPFEEITIEKIILSEYSS